VTASWAYAAYSVNIIDAVVADLGLTAHNLYAGGWLHFSGVDDLRIGSFNAASGAYILQAVAAKLPNPIPSGLEYERHAMVAPADKDRALDDAVQRVRVRQEVGITTLSGAVFYDLDTAASPHRIADVLDAYVWSDPSNTGNRDKRLFRTAPRVVPTATGVELRIDTALDLSSLLVVDALLELTLGAGDAATITVPDERLVLSGAAAKCWDLLAQRSPGTQVAVYELRRDKAAQQFSDLSARYKPPTARRLGFSDVF